MPVHVASRPTKPLVIFDGSCEFCRLWIARWQQTAGEHVEYVPFQNPGLEQQFPELRRADLEQAAHLIEPNGQVYRGAEAVFRALASGQGASRGLWAYESLPGFALVAEWVYCVIARHRQAAALVTRCLWGGSVQRPTYLLSRWVMLRLLGVIYLIAFVSLWTQIGGLVGSEGILPANQWMEQAREVLGYRLDLLPTLMWFNTSDVFLHVQCAAGSVCALLLIFGIAPAPALLLLWVLYLSLVVVCREFLAFQWDALLLETGLLAVFFAPWNLLPRLDRERRPSPVVLILLRWLLFRLMFQSGCMKLLSEDPTWWNLTALRFHYETQPLPTWIGWYAHQLPNWFQSLSAGIMFIIELGVPFLFFLPRRARVFAFGATVGLMTLIAATGNYCYFNFIAVALCVLLLDDRSLGRVLPRRLTAAAANSGSRLPEFRVKQASVALVASCVLVVSGSWMLAMFWRTRALPGPLRSVLVRSIPFHSVNSYGLFAVMTTARPEIIIEGSDDGVAWRAYEFKYKPGDLMRRPGFVAPHQTRLDWQMWFAALGRWQENPWFLSFLARLLEGSPPVLRLLAENPFPDGPPKHVRAVLYDYRFTDWATRRANGAWWQRNREALYCPVLTRSGEE